MSQRERELIAVAVSVASGCERCIAYHVKVAREAAATEADLRRMVEAALAIRAWATDRMADTIARELGEEPAGPRGRQGEACHIDGLACAAAALAANWGVGVPDFVSAARQAGASEVQVTIALGIARMIKKVAAEKADAETSGGQGGTSLDISGFTYVTGRGAGANLLLSTGF